MKYFVEVVKQGGMTNASKSLYIAQPTISKAIKDIEAEMAVPLFDRSKRNLVLTDAGKIFFNKCKEIISLYDNLPTEINSLYGLETGHINISMSAVMSMRNFIGILGDFHQLYPNITYNLIESGGKTTENLILNDEVDIGVTTVPVDHHLFESISINKEDLRLVNEDFYLNDKIIENAKNAGFVPNMASQISQWNVIENLIINKLGITILPATISELLNDDVKMIQLENANTEWELGVVWKKDKRLSHATNKWIEFLKEKLTEQKQSNMFASIVIDY